MILRTTIYWQQLEIISKSSDDISREGRLARKSTTYKELSSLGLRADAVVKRVILASRYLEVKSSKISAALCPPPMTAIRLFAGSNLGNSVDTADRYCEECTTRGPTCSSERGSFGVPPRATTTCWVVIVFAEPRFLSRYVTCHESTMFSIDLAGATDVTSAPY